jgi:hypothetical protein
MGRREGHSFIPFGIHFCFLFKKFVYFCMRSLFNPFSVLIPDSVLNQQVV